LKLGRNNRSRRSHQWRKANRQSPSRQFD